SPEQKLDDQTEEALIQQNIAFTSRRTAGDNPLDSVDAGRLRARAAHDAKKHGHGPPPASGPITFDAGWGQIGPNPIVQVLRSTNTFGAMAGRIGALAIRPSNHQIILGAAQGGIWLYDPA